MAKIVLIGCGAKKATIRCAAKDMYQGSLFKKAYAYALKLKPDKIYILSAKHHSLELNKVINPYNETLNGKSSQCIKSWSNNVLNELKDNGHNLQNDEFVILAGKNYHKYLTAKLQNVVLPYSNCKGIGYIMQFLNNQLNN